MAEYADSNYDPGQDKDMDSGIIDTVRMLRAGNVETFESCEGGEGHPFFEPTVRFHGGRAGGH